MKHLFSFFALFSLIITTHAQENLLASDTLQYIYNLVVETETIVLDTCQFSTENATGEAMVHRFYVEAEYNSDKMSAVFGNDEKPLIINAPGGVFNHSLDWSWNASALNPLLESAFLSNCIAATSYATINLDSPQSEVAGAEDPQLAEDFSLYPTVSEFFQANTFGGPSELTVNTVTGASWYVLSTAANALPDEDGRWLVMQLTSAAHVEGVLNFQIHPQGSLANTIQITRPFDSEQVCGDPYACNYEPDAPDNPNLCDYSCCPGPGCCGEGTTWDSESQTCLTTYLHDADFDGCVGLSDLLSLLSVFGSCLEE